MSFLFVNQHLQFLESPFVEQHPWLERNGRWFGSKSRIQYLEVKGLLIDQKEDVSEEHCTSLKLIGQVNPLGQEMFFESYTFICKNIFFSFSPLYIPFHCFIEALFKGHSVTQSSFAVSTNIYFKPQQQFQMSTWKYIEFSLLF